MNLNIAENFLLLHMKPRGTGYYKTGSALPLGLTGAILLDLSAWKHFHTSDGRIVINHLKHELQQPHLAVRDLMRDSGKAWKIKRWLSRLSRKAAAYQREAWKQLIAKDQVMKVPLSFLGIRYHRYVLHPNSQRPELEERLRQAVFGHRRSEGSDMEVLGLIGACKLYHLICRNRKEIQTCRKILAELVRSGFINPEVDELIRETQAAVMGAIIASTAASTAATTAATS